MNVLEALQTMSDETVMWWTSADGGGSLDCYGMTVAEAVADFDSNMPDAYDDTRAGSFSFVPHVSRICALRDEAGVAGDLDMVQTCTAALDGEREAIEEVADALFWAAGQ
jgi:hypothetical protein